MEAYTIPTDHWEIRDGFSVYVTCPGCDRSMPLDHDVADDGTVRPSLDCPVPGCDFHEHVRLERWEPQ